MGMKEEGFSLKALMKEHIDYLLEKRKSGCSSKELLQMLADFCKEKHGMDLPDISLNTFKNYFSRMVRNISDKASAHDAIGKGKAWHPLRDPELNLPPCAMAIEKSRKY